MKNIYIIVKSMRWDQMDWEQIISVHETPEGAYNKLIELFRSHIEKEDLTYEMFLEGMKYNRSGDKLMIKEMPLLP